MLFLFSQPPITVGAQSLILKEIPVTSHGTASAVMYVAYQFGSALFLAIVNVVLGSSDQSTPEGLLKGYHNSMWTLLGIMALGFLVFVSYYILEGLFGRKGKTASDSVQDEVASGEEQTGEDSRNESFSTEVKSAA